MGREKKTRNVVRGEKKIVINENEFVRIGACSDARSSIITIVRITRIHRRARVPSFIVRVGPSTVAVERERKKEKSHSKPF